MHILILGRGKTGSLVAEVAAERRHQIQVAGAKENAGGAALTPDRLREIDAVIDFTAPHVVTANIEACVKAGKNIIVGTTGWYGEKNAELERVRGLVEQHGTGFLYGANFSIGIGLFFEATRAAAAALRHGYSGQIFERHHAGKKDAPSGTALTMQRIVREASGQNPDDQSKGPEITSFREGEVVGLHEIVFESGNDRIYLCHDAKSRRGFAEGAVRAAEWLAGKKGFYEFKDIWREL
jgi:4-hydroxy-tetrahydrodipicolinate reductase